MTTSTCDRTGPILDQQFPTSEPAEPLHYHDIRRRNRYGACAHTDAILHRY